MELFNRFAARALAQLREAFPNRSTLLPEQIVEEEGIDLERPNALICYDTLAWLHDEGYFTTQFRSLGTKSKFGFGGFVGAQLTDKGLAAMNVEVSLGDETRPVGEILVEQVKGAAEETRSAVIGEIIGKIIGAAAKTILGP